MKPLRAFLLALALFSVSATFVHAAEKRVALVVGNSTYPSSRLDNPKNDATAMAATFRRLGFDVELVIDAGKADFDAAQKRFAVKADKATAAVLFYAGHGIQANNYNYLVPIDAKPQSERDLKREMVKLDDIIDDMGNAKVKLVFFDACRDNPLARSFGRGGSRGMAAPNEASGTLISFATKHGNTASDGEGKHSPYTESLLAALENPTEEVHALLRKKVQEAVKKRTQGQQEPWAYGNLNGDFYFIQGPVNITVNPAAPPRIKSDAEREEELWDSIKDANSADVLNEYLRHYPKGKYVAQAKILLAKLKKDSRAESIKPATSPPTAGSPEDALWSAVERGNSADDYDAYLNQYPKGKYAALAKSRKQKLEEQAQREAIQKEQDAWNSAESGNSEEAYNAYLKAYSAGQYAQLAQGRIRKLQTDTKARAEQEARQREAQAEQTHWQQAEQSNDKAKVNAYLTQYPSGRHAGDARQKLAQIEKEEAELRPGKVFKDCADCPEMVVIPAGSFVMGSPAGETGRQDSEGPQHTVRVAQPFAMGKFEVTRGQFAAFARESGHNAGNECWTFEGGKYEKRANRNWQNPGYSQSDDHPVACVNWDDAKAYVAWLARKTGKAYRLPSEAEWEYTARAGSSTARPWGDNPDDACRHANVMDSTGKSQVSGVTWAIHNCNDGAAYTARVGNYQANAFKLHDMIGNVWEWTEDCGNGNYNGAPTDGSAWTSGKCDVRVLRGGSWFINPDFARSAIRFGYDSTNRYNYIGLRVSRMLP